MSALQRLDFIPGNWKLGVGGLWIPLSEFGELVFFSTRSKRWLTAWLDSCMLPVCASFPEWVTEGAWCSSAAAPYPLLQDPPRQRLGANCSVHLQHSSNRPKVSRVPLQVQEGGPPFARLVTFWWVPLVCSLQGTRMLSSLPEGFEQNLVGCMS